MKKIIKSGNVPLYIKRFRCPFCGCIFNADQHEYDYIDFSWSGDLIAESKCPECRKQAHEINEEID